jgi:hypothetical protein
VAVVGLQEVVQVVEALLRARLGLGAALSRERLRLGHHTSFPAHTAAAREFTSHLQLVVVRGSDRQSGCVILVADSLQWPRLATYPPAPTPGPDPNHHQHFEVPYLIQPILVPTKKGATIAV